MLKVVFSVILCLVLLSNSLHSQVTMQDSQGINILPINQRIDTLLNLASDIVATNPDLGYEYANWAFQLTDSIEDPTRNARALNSMGLAYEYQNNARLALRNYLRSIDIAKRGQDSVTIAESYFNIGIAYKKLDNYNLSLENLLKSLTYWQEIGNQRAIANVLNNIGIIYLKIGDYQKAKVFFEDALEIRLKVDHVSGVAGSYNNLGLVFSYLGEYEKALDYQLKSLAIKRKTGTPNRIANSLNSVGMVLYEMGELNKALLYQKEAYSIFDSINNKRGQTFVLYDIGKIYLGQRKFSLAQVNLTKALKIGHEISALNLVVLIYEAFYELYNEQYDYYNALNYYILYSRLKDSVFSMESRNKIRELETIYETEKKEKQIELLNKEKELNKNKILIQKILLYSAIGGLIFFIAYVFLLYNRNTVKRRANAILSQQNKQIQQQKEELEAQRDKIFLQNESITDSIRYASRIQNALLPDKEELNQYFPESFIFYMPKDIVSGDFYWFTKIQNNIILTVVDCTGHGVPGAFMSMIGISFLNKIVNEKNIVEADQILNRLRKNVIYSLKQTGKLGEANDGMELALIVINEQKTQLEFSGAMNPLYLVRNGELKEYLPNKMPTGIYEFINTPFSKQTIPIEKNDMIYLFSDGYPDQFGGKHNKKLLYTNFKMLLSSISHLPAKSQKAQLNDSLKKWMGSNEQVDDILVMGIRI